MAGANHGVILVRPAAADDAEAVTNVFLAARQHSLAYLPRLYTDAQTLAFFTGIVAKGGVTIIEVEGKVAAFLALDGDDVDHLYVHPQNHRQGLGATLLEETQKQRDRLELWVFQRNEGAIAFYMKHGFVVIHSSDGQRNEEKEPDHRMAWLRSK
ncbi:GCN5-like N-acetyltransferase [Thelonectria olida]|uniref:GCN5-like N-acetyltransferase n=1 Tax=Thelonectria olida TaxID=1576542 RepID=A0A9P9ANJ2_9HYPO|nr:GCN5-like N-acetyltransferase [Thelonectria olida]